MNKLTVVTVCYNAVCCIEKTIQSVINQRYSDFEYIVIDGKSTDGTFELINRYRREINTFISESDSGIYDAMNKAIKLATGDYVLFLNADDILFDEMVLENIASHIKMNCADIYYGNVLIVNEYGRFMQKPQPIELLNTKMIFSHQAVFAKLSILKNHLFDLQYKYSADFEQLSSLYLGGYRFKYVDNVISIVPVNSGATYNNYIVSLKEHFKILEQRGYNVSYWKGKTLFLSGLVRVLKKITPDFILYPALRYLSRYKIL